jgi:hypothetical protein
MAVYGHALPADDIAQHNADWLERKPHLLQGARALYTFDEQAGDVIHNRTGSAPDLIIPTTFKPLHPNGVGGATSVQTTPNRHCR